MPYAWLAEGLAEEQALMGADPYPYGLAANRSTVEALARYAHTRASSHCRLAPEELFELGSTPLHRAERRNVYRPVGSLSFSTQTQYHCSVLGEPPKLMVQPWRKG